MRSVQHALTHSYTHFGRAIEPLKPTLSTQCHSQHQYMLTLHKEAPVAYCRETLGLHQGSSLSLLLELCEYEHHTPRCHSGCQKIFVWLRQSCVSGRP